MNKTTKTFVSNTSKGTTESGLVRDSAIKFVAKVPGVLVNRRVTISSNFSIAKAKK